MKISSYVTFALSLATASSAEFVFAQSPPGSIPVGPMFAYPSLEVAVRRDDNIAVQPDALRISDTIWYLRPAVRLEARRGANFYDVGYRGEYGRYNTQT